MTDAVIVAAARSPIGRAFKGSLVDLRPDDLAAQIVTAVLAQLPQLDPREIEDLILGCGLPGGEQGFNMARVVSTLAGLPDTPGTTVNRYCASSLQATRMAAHAVRANEGHVFLAAGVECVSRFVKGNSDTLPDTANPRFIAAVTRSSNRSVDDPEPWTRPDGLPDVYIAMGQTAENVAQVRGVTRREQDEYAAQSQQRTAAAIQSGFFEVDITPVVLPDGTIVGTDDGPRPDTTIESLSRLTPAFRPGGSVTAGNSCPLNDGAAAVVVMSDQRARDLAITPLARIVSTSVSGIHPEIMGLGPIDACRIALERAALRASDIDLAEINEAFAAQVIPSMRDIGISRDRLNVHGGAIALGHPFGMTGARLITTLINGLQAHDKTLGLVSMCVGGGQGMAMVIERLS